MKYSPTMLNTYLDCPYKFKLAYIIKAKPTEIEAMVRGRKVHEIVEGYYTSIPSDMTPAEIPIYLSQTVKRLGILSDDVDVYLRGFKKFEEKRLMWGINLKPLAIEQMFEKGIFRGVVDIIFAKKNEDKNTMNSKPILRVGIDWKSGWGVNFNGIDHAIQAIIYFFVADLDKFYFVSIPRGEEILFDKSDLISYKPYFQKALDGIRNLEYPKNLGDRCKGCQYSVACFTEKKNFFEVT